MDCNNGKDSGNPTSAHRLASTHRFIKGDGELEINTIRIFELPHERHGELSVDVAVDDASHSLPQYPARILISTLEIPLASKICCTPSQTSQTTHGRIQGVAANFSFELILGQKNARSLLRPAPTPYRNNSDPPLYTTTGVHDAAAPNSLVYSPTHYRRSQRDIASPDAIPTLRRKPADAVIPTSGHTNTVPPPLPTQTEVPSAPWCFSDSALQVWLNIDGQELVESTKQTTVSPINSRTRVRLAWPRIVNFAPAEVRSWDSKVHKTLFKTKLLSLSFKTRKTVIVHLDYGPRDRQSAPAVRDAETIVPKDRSWLKRGEPRTYGCIDRVILKHRGLEIFQIYIEVSHQLPPSRSKSMTIDRDHKTKKTILLLTQNDSAPQESRGIFLSSIFSESRGPRGCVTKRPLSMASSRCPMNGVQVIFHVLSVVTHIDLHFHLRLGTHSISTRSNSGLRVRLVFSSTTMVSSHSLSQNGHNLSIPSNVPKCCLPASCIRSRDSGLSTSLTPQPLSGLLGTDNIISCSRQNLWSFRHRSSCTPLLPTFEQHLSRGEVLRFSGDISVELSPSSYLDLPPSNPTLTILSSSSTYRLFALGADDEFDSRTTLGAAACKVFPFYRAVHTALPLPFSETTTSGSMHYLLPFRARSYRTRLNAAPENALRRGSDTTLSRAQDSTYRFIALVEVVQNCMQVLRTLSAVAQIGTTHPWFSQQLYSMHPDFLHNHSKASFLRLWNVHSDQLLIWDSTHKPGSRACVLRSEASEARVYDGGGYPACTGSVTEAHADVYVRSEARRGRDAGETQLATEASEPRVSEHHGGALRVAMSAGGIFKRGWTRASARKVIFRLLTSNFRFTDFTSLSPNKSDSSMALGAAVYNASRLPTPMSATLSRTISFSRQSSGAGPYSDSPMY
ncbi:hypothetical protein DFH09DRAFT_1078253 [Mycena vulgaris]|nr:hypothetical protein DFH09DRAFT_1078253 [Mycena vulgaris]